MNATISFGRNVGQVPMDPDAWADFQARTVRAIGAVDGEILFSGTGLGRWVEDDGTEVTEEACTFIVEIGTARLPRLRVLLADLAARFRQDAVALLAGDTDLVRPAPLFQAVGVEV